MPKYALSVTGTYTYTQIVEAPNTKAAEELLDVQDVAICYQCGETGIELDEPNTTNVDVMTHYDDADEDDEY